MGADHIELYDDKGRTLPMPPNYNPGTGEGGGDAGVCPQAWGHIVPGPDDIADEVNQY